MYDVRKVAAGILLILSVLISLKYAYHTTPTSSSEGTAQVTADEPVVDVKYGYDLAQYTIEDYLIRPNAFMADILMSHDVPYQKILDLEKEAQDFYSLRKIQAGKNIHLIKKDPCDAPIGFVYQTGLFSYMTYEFEDDICVKRNDIPYQVCRETASGVVTSSLWNAMVDQGFDFSLIDKMEDAISQVNFYTAQVGDQFKLVYEQIYVDGVPVTTGKIFSAAYSSGGIVDYGFYFENDKYKGYYDFDGVPNKKTFLNAPLRFSRVSSFFNPNRFHPVLKRRRPHLGTDYAAPTGTPIFAVADGVITHRSYTSGNGNYVKIKHDKVYQTQYLHMSRFVKGQKVGSRVRQGEVIGYVGQTGLATGPHVCFRFWKNGRQVNHLRENFPPLHPMDASDLPVFYETRDALFTELEGIPFSPEGSLTTADF